jgi:hypothetical protein
MLNGPDVGHLSVREAVQHGFRDQIADVAVEPICRERRRAHTYDDWQPRHRYDSS